MRIEIELLKKRCTGLGICESLAEEYFEITDDGSLRVLRQEVDPDDLERVEQTIRSCPTEALKLNRVNGA